MEDGDVVAEHRLEVGPTEAALPAASGRCGEVRQLPPVSTCLRQNVSKKRLRADTPVDDDRAPRGSDLVVLDLVVSNASSRLAIHRGIELEICEETGGLRSQRFEHLDSQPANLAFGAFA